MIETVRSLSIDRREFLRASAGALAATALSGAAPSAAPAKRPNVIFFFDDQLRADVCGCFGGGRNIPTPHIDRLASQGTVFTHALSSCPLCTPHRGMVQTGRHPTHSGLVLNWVNANPRQRCLAHVFRDAGYRTGFIGKWHLAAGDKKHAGLHNMTAAEKQRANAGIKQSRADNPETEFVPPGPMRLGYDHWEAYNFHSSFRRAYYYRDSPRRLIMNGYETDAEIDMAIEFMRQQQDAPDPFFLTIAPHPPHPPWNPAACPEGYLEKVGASLHWSPNVPPDFALRQNPLPARCYFAMASNVDDNVGRLMVFLDQSGLAANTIVVFTSDHGEMMGSHGRQNKMVPYAEAVNIPLIVRWPGRVTAGARSDVLYTPIDHYRTLCTMAGLQAPDTVDGADLSLAATGRRVDRESVLMANYVSHWDYCDTGTLWPEWRAVKTRTHTYVKWLDGLEELYDDAQDPYQMTNLVEGRKDLPTLQRLRAQLKDRLAEAHDAFLPGTAYADWYDSERNLVQTAIGPA